MKKVLISALMTGGLIIGGTMSASAAITHTSIKKPSLAKHAEGTAGDEMSESATKQKKEATTSEKRHSSKKVAKKHK